MSLQPYTTFIISMQTKAEVKLLIHLPNNFLQLFGSSQFLLTFIDQHYFGIILQKYIVNLKSWNLETDIIDRKVYVCYAYLDTCLHIILSPDSV